MCNALSWVSHECVGCTRLVVSFTTHVLLFAKAVFLMQGGRDKLGWVRQLVKYTETHPIYIPDAASSAVKVLEDGQIQKTVFPSLKPTRREDALLLQQWLADMMAQLTSNAPQAPADQVRPTFAACLCFLAASLNLRTLPY